MAKIDDIMQSIIKSKYPSDEKMRKIRKNIMVSDNAFCNDSYHQVALIVNRSFAILEKIKKQYQFNWY